MAPEQSATNHVENQKSVENTGLEQFNGLTQSDHLFHFAEKSTAFHFLESDTGKLAEDMMIRSLYPQLQAKRQLQGIEISKGIKRLSNHEELSYLQQVKDFILNNPQHGNLLAAATPQIQSEMQTLFTTSTTLDEFMTYIYSGLIFRETAVLYKKYYSSGNPLSQIPLKELFWIGYEGLAKALQKASTSPQSTQFSGYAYKWIKGRLQDYIFSKFEERTDLSLDMPLGEPEDSISLKDIIPAESSNPESTYDTNHLVTNLRQIVAFFPPDSQEYQILTYFLSGKSNFADLKRDVFANENVNRLIAFWHWRVMPEAQMLYRLFTNPTRLTRKKFSELMQSSDSLQQYLTISSDETSPLKQILQQHEALSPQKRRITTAITLLDTMAHLSLADKLAFLVLQEQQAHRKQMKFSDNIRSDIHVAELFGLSPDLVGIIRTQIETTQKERFERFGRWIDRYIILQAVPSVNQSVTTYNEFYHWLYEQFTTTKISFQELVYQIPPYLATVENLGNSLNGKAINKEWRLRNEASKMADSGFLNLTDIKRRNVKREITTDIIQRKLDEGRRAERPVTLDELAQATGLSPRMVQAYLPTLRTDRNELLRGPDPRTIAILDQINAILDEITDSQDEAARSKITYAQLAKELKDRYGIDATIPQLRKYYIKYSDYLRVTKKSKAQTDQADIDKVYELADAGSSPTEIIAQTGFPKATVYKLLQKRNVANQS